MANGNGWKAPHTETPELVLITLLAMGIVLGATLCFLLGNWWILGLITTFVILGCSTGLYTVGVPQYYAIIMMDNFWGGGKQRVVFQGVHLKYPWESPQLRGSQKDFINLRTEVSGVIKDETYPTSDGLVVGTYVFTMKINISDPDNASGNVLRWASYDSDAALRVLRALVSRTFSSFSETHKTEELIRMDNETVNKEAFPAGKAEIVEFEKKYGAEITVTLEDLDRDPTLQKAKDTIAEAESYAAAKKALMADSKMSDEAATQFLKLMSFKNVSEQTWRVDVTGLDLSKLEHFNLLGTPKPNATGGNKK